MSVWMQGAQSVLTRDGVNGASEATLGWFLVITSCVVVIVITAAVLMATFRHRNGRGDRGRAADTLIPLDAHREATENRWLTGLAILVPAIVLTVSFLFTIRTINAVGSPAHPFVGTISVIGHQWWWEVTYGEGANPGFTTANEIHVPVGEPVQVQLRTADVIHSFWIPQLAGKMDLIPGLNNSTWIEAKAPGVYAGSCAQFCGNQHAKMRLTVVAESPEDYRAWLAKQASAATDARDSTVQAGRNTFLASGCATCHTIRGTPAGGGIGPDLTHFGSRTTLGAGALPNTPAALMSWIDDAQGVKPGSDMPRMNVPARDLSALAAYLETLK